MSKRNNSRVFVSISLFTFFWVMLITSIFMFARRHTVTTSIVHTVLGLCLLLLVFWHIKSNWPVLKQHFRLRSRGADARLNVALLVALSMSFGVLLLSLLQFSPLLAFYEWGSTLRVGGKVLQQNQFTYLRVDKATGQGSGTTLSIDVRTGPFFAWPQYALWLESMDGDLIQPLYVTAKAANNRFNTKVTKRNKSLVLTSNPMTSGEYDPEDIFDFVDEPATASERLRPESLPVFLHKLKAHHTDAAHAVIKRPQPDDTLEGLDGYSGATLLQSFLLSARTDQPLPEQYKVRMEINQSFDFNRFYSSDRFPQDPIYSGDGYSAQPSVVYEAIIDTALDQKYHPMKVVGRGHHSGRDGQLHPDLGNLTTALELIDRVIVEVDSPSLAGKRVPKQ